MFHGLAGKWQVKNRRFWHSQDDWEAIQFLGNDLLKSIHDSLEGWKGRDLYCWCGKKTNPDKKGGKTTAIQ